MANYRIKEHNSAYDEHFGKGKRWIYVSNNIKIKKIAKYRAYILTKMTGFKHTVDKV